jgi:hypothetical protein
LLRRHFEDEPTDVRTLRTMVDMPLVTVLAVRTVRLDARQAHGAAGAVRAFPMIEIRMHGDALSLITLPPLVANAFCDASFRLRRTVEGGRSRIFVVAQTSKRFGEMVSDQTRIIWLPVIGVAKSKPIPGWHLVCRFLTAAPNAGDPGQRRGARRVNARGGMNGAAATDV